MLVFDSCNAELLRVFNVLDFHMSLRRSGDQKMKAAGLMALTALLAGCATYHGQVAAECQQLGLTPGTAGFIDCVQRTSDRDLAWRQYYDDPPYAYDDYPGWWGGAVIIDRDRDRDQHEDVRRFGEGRERFAPVGEHFSHGGAFSHGSRG
jgi:hypothetical protein